MREVREELGLDVTVEGPLYEESNRFLHHGEIQDNTDYLFRASCATDAPELKGVTEDEIAIMREIRWWTAEEVLHAQERIFPVDLAAKMRECVSHLRR